MRILVVDDNQIVRQCIVEILSEKGWEVCEEVAGGDEAIRKVRIAVPDLVLLDISMPGKNGFEVARLMRQEHPKLKIILLSQNDAGYMVSTSTNHSIDGFVDKARMATDLIPTIETVCR